MTAWVNLDSLGFPDYKIGTDGSIWSWKCKAGTKKKRWKELKPWNSKGYLIIGLNSNGIRHYRYIHLLVLEAFVSKRPEGLEGCHGNDNSLDNRLENLRWDTPKNNCADREKNGNTAKGITHGKHILNEEDVIEVKRLYATGEYTQEEIGMMFNVTRHAISSIVRNKNWRHLI